MGHPIDFPMPSVKTGSLRKLPVNLEGERNINRTVLQVEVANGVKAFRYYEVGDFLKKAIFGQVNFGYVLQLKDGKLQRICECAIKVYSKALVQDLRGVTQENPLLEIAAQQFLGTHQNIATGIECCHDAENIYSIMEFCTFDLCETILSGGKVKSSEAKCYFRQIATGVRLMHSKGVAHRDISLENVMLTSTGVCKIIDFGMSIRLPPSQRSVASSSSSSVSKIPPQGVCGKQHYVSPEVIQNKEAFDGLASDIWALGVMLFILLAGFPPLDAASPIDPRFDLLRQGHLSTMMAQWGVPVEAEAMDLISRMLREDPSDRLRIDEILRHPWLQEPDTSMPLASEISSTAAFVVSSSKPGSDEAASVAPTPQLSRNGSAGAAYTRACRVGPFEREQHQQHRQQQQQALGGDRATTVE